MRTIPEPPEPFITGVASSASSVAPPPPPEFTFQHHLPFVLCRPPLPPPAYGPPSPPPLPC